ncbi:MAG: hypothetical protein JOZ15_20865 [Acidobacteria bacterium]|nr:hypothetical protein [Acidobacteriota bacterium]
MAATAAQPGLGPFSQWTVAGNSIVAYGSVRSPRYPEGFALGFLRLRVPGSGAPDAFWPFPQHRFYRIGYPYVASVGQTAYFLAMSQTATLNQIAPNGNPVPLPEALPSEFRTLPTLTSKMTGPADAPALFAELERATMPAGLYGTANGLYLLARRPASTGGTDWLLFQVGAEGTKIRGLGYLRSAAKHLTVVPSPKEWYFFERGDVELTGRQDIRSMVVVPSTRLAAMTAQGIDLCPERGR